MQTAVRVIHLKIKVIIPLYTLNTHQSGFNHGSCVEMLSAQMAYLHGFRQPIFTCSNSSHTRHLIQDVKIFLPDTAKSSPATLGKICFHNIVLLCILWWVLPQPDILSTEQTWNAQWHNRLDFRQRYFFLIFIRREIYEEQRLTPLDGWELN